MNAPPGLPRSLLDNPILSTWIGFPAPGKVLVKTGKVELGQGIVTALVQIAAEELDVDPARISCVSGDTACVPQEWYTSGSVSIEVGGGAMRLACADARQRFRAAAARRMGVDPESLHVSDGSFHDREGGPRLTYWDLAADVDLEVKVSGLAPVKPSDSYRLVGRSLPRTDLAAKIRGGAYLHDLAPAGMLHGRVLRPATYHGRLERFDDAAVRALPGVVAVVRDGSFVGVVAKREDEAMRAVAAAAKHAAWSTTGPALPAGDLADYLRAHPAEKSVRVSREGAKVDSREGAKGKSGARTHKAVYSRPFIAHASIGPSCALALLDKDTLTVWSHSQGVFALRTAIARTLRMDPAQVRLVHVPGSGCYGHNGADDVALDAALLARAAPGSTVRVQWSREDELAWSPFGSGMAVEITAELDGNGAITGWRHEIWSGPHGMRPGWGDGVNLLAAEHLQEPIKAARPAELAAEMGGGSDRNAIPLYEVGKLDVVSNLLTDFPVRTSSLRTLGAHANVFALESFMDELAELAGADPLEYRLRHLTDERAKEVLRRAAALAGWPKGRSGRPGAALGLAFARYKNKAAYSAVVVELVLEEDIRVLGAYSAVDAGLAVNPDGVVNQIEGGILQSLSWTLREAGRFEDGRAASVDWESYPIFHFADIPAEVRVEVIQRVGEAPLGVGEASQGPTAAAVANALARAAGMRFRHPPLNRERIAAEMTRA